MAKTDFLFSRRHALTMRAVGALAAGAGSKGWAQTAGPPTLLMDGHVHVTASRTPGASLPAASNTSPRVLDKARA